MSVPLATGGPDWEREDRRRRDPGEVILAAPHPRISPDRYEAFSTAVHRRWAHQREYVEVLFTIYAGPITQGQVLATGVPGFYRLPPKGRPLAPSSALARLISFVRSTGRRDRFALRDLVRKAWRVEVVEVTTDSRGRDLPLTQRYSKVAQVLERL
jgi:hypothetical protein